MRLPTASDKFIPGVILLLLMLPLLCININHFHDWGDDFAHYLLQSQSMAGTISVIPVSDVSGYSPEKKGLLFSLLMVPVAFLKTDIITGGKLIVSVSLLFTGFMLFRLIHKKQHAGVAVLISLFFVYNSHVLHLKDQVLPDLLFTGTVLAVMLLLSQAHGKYLWAAMLLAGLSTGLRSAGYALVLAIVLATIFERNAPLRQHRIKNLALLFSACLVILLWENVASSSRSGAVWYTFLTVNQFEPHVITGNFPVYQQAFNLFFEQELPLWMNVITKYLVLAGFAGGFIIQCRNGQLVTCFFTICYFLFLLLYPYHQDPVRFIIPVMPIVLFFTLSFYSSLSGMMTSRYRAIVPLTVAIVLAGGQVITTQKAITSQRIYEPFTPSGIEMIRFVANDLPGGDTISFNKPWALAFFTGRHCVPATASYKSDWMVFDKATVNISGFNAQNQVKTVFENNEYIVVKANQEPPVRN